MAPHLLSIADLETLRDRILIGEGAPRSTIVISAGTCGQASGANAIIRLVKRKIIGDDLHDRISLRITGCHGYCQIEPFVVIEPEGTLYPRLDPKNVDRIIDAALAKEVVEDLVSEDSETGEREWDRVFIIQWICSAN